MSAFIVSDVHIDYLLSVACFGPNCGGVLAYWHKPRFASASVEVFDLDKIGECLKAENFLSVHFRYKNSPYVVVSEPMTYKWRDHRRMITAVEALKLLKCYEYQACEHPGWETSATKRFCGELKEILIGCLDGFKEAPWGLDDPRAIGVPFQTLKGWN